MRSNFRKSPTRRSTRRHRDDSATRVERFRLRLSALQSAAEAQRALARARERRATTQAKVHHGTAHALDGFVAPWLLLKPERKFRLYVPEHRRSERLPLVVMIHGCRQSADDFEHGTRFSELADREDFAVLYPEQTGLANLRRCWNWFDSNTASGRGECAIVRAMIEIALDRAGCDPSLVFIAGLSSGAALARLLAFHYPTEFRAVAMHSGLPPLASPTIASAVVAMKRGVRVDRDALAKAYWTRETQMPPPLLVIHGDEDARVHERNGTALVKTWEHLFETAPSAEPLRREIAAVEARDGARGYTQTELSLNGRVVVRGVRIHGLAHAWSGGDAEYPFNDAKGPDASRMIWKFFEAQR